MVLCLVIGIFGVAYPINYVGVDNVTEWVTYCIIGYTYHKIVVDQIDCRVVDEIDYMAVDWMI